MDLADLNKVWEVKPLKKPGEDGARGILQRVAKQVQPIMKKRKWRVKVLSEFCPANPALLGLNVGGGVQVKLRLRRPNRDWDFFPYEQVLDTMLHELCHIEHGPHNADFYKLWDEIRKECEDLIANGITGTGKGFDLSGRRLGGFSRQPPLSALRQATVAAAEKRSRVGSLLPSGPKRLGGDSTIMSVLSPIQAAAMAAERRMQDDLWCGSESCESSTVENDTSNLGQFASRETAELLRNSIFSGKGTSSVVTDGKNNALNCFMNNKRGRDSIFVSKKHISESSSNDRHLGASSSVSIPNLRGAGDLHDGESWECSICTLFNQGIAPICEACGTKKPTETGSIFKVWACKFCTLENSTVLDKCSACEQWRYSYGAPVSTRAPNIGT